MICCYRGGAFKKNKSFVCTSSNDIPNHTDRTDLNHQKPKNEQFNKYIALAFVNPLGLSLGAMA
jgi:hypothetical protein